LAIVEQAVPESADQQQIYPSRTGRHQSGDNLLQSVGFLNLGFHCVMDKQSVHNLQHKCRISCRVGFGGRRDQGHRRAGLPCGEARSGHLFTISDLRFTILSEAMRQPEFAADKQHDSAKLTPR
jgi:hypothetical protein